MALTVLCGADFSLLFGTGNSRKSTSLSKGTLTVQITKLRLERKQQIDPSRNLSAFFPVAYVSSLLALRTLQRLKLMCIL